MKQAPLQERVLTTAAFSFGLAGLLAWLLAHLVGGAALSLPNSSGFWVYQEAVACLAGSIALFLSTLALRHVQPETVLHRRATEGFVFGIIVLALTVGLQTIHLF
ncbi:MAG: hypothetical protein DCC55_08605 [Chloroflexi bacterium]|nr:MAG: hypothetical protein DCC55_08605 [Chloroflexota bacterium]